jgi:membrane associated rhomboid family serine protease
MSSDADGPSGKPFAGIGGGLLALMAVCCLIESILQLGDLGLFGVPRFRSLVYEYGGFWPGLLGSWKPNYPLQPATMFLTYGFLHAGLVHLIVNMITLVSLGRPVLARVGTARAALLYGGALIGGAAGFALLADTYRPMVGASGALFGLAGAILAWEYSDRAALREKLWPVVRAVLFLAALNAVLYVAMHGLLAWQTHLGGFVAGWALGLLIDTGRDPDNPVSRDGPGG